MAAVRRAYVTQAGSAPALSYWDGLVQTQTVSPPLLGGVSASGVYSGVLSALPQGAQVAVLCEEYAGGRFPAASVALTQVPGDLPALNSGETAIYGPTGQVLLTAKSTGLTLSSQSTANSASSGGASALPATPAAYLALSINGTTYKLPLYNT